MAQQIVCEANAKINLFLELTGKRENGYHNIESVMQSVSLSDTVTVTEADDGIIITTDADVLPTDEHNIAYKCAKAFFDLLGKKGGCLIDIKKRIPMFAGMGGGSADGAAVLIALDILYGIPFSEDELCKIGATVGADIPFCIVGGSCFVTGFGEEVGKLDKLPKAYLLIVKPEEGISTKEAFGTLDRINGEYKAYIPRKSDSVLDAAVSGDVEKIGHILYNCFEVALNENCPKTLSIIAELKKYAGNSLLCGSGSAVFALFDTKEKAIKTQKYMSDIFSDCFINICEFTDKGVSLKEFREV